MFYPGDPIEDRKRQLIARLSGARGGKGGGGMRLGRAPGFFGRGMMGGFAGNPGLGRAMGMIPQQAQKAAAFESFPTQPFQGPMGGPPSPSFFGGGMMNPGITQLQMPGGFDIRQLLQQYGQPPAPTGMWGRM